MGKSPKQYSKKLRRKVLDEAQSLTAVALSCGVPVGLIDHWVDEGIGARGTEDYEGYSREALEDECERLIRELKYLLARRDIADDVISGFKGDQLDFAGLELDEDGDNW